MVLHRARLCASKQLQARQLPSTEYEKSGNFKAPQTEVISIQKTNYRVRGQILTLGPFLGLQGLKHGLSLKDGCFPFKPPFSASPGRTLSVCTSLNPFFGCAKDAFKLFLSLYQPPGSMVCSESCTFSASQPLFSG